MIKSRTVQLIYQTVYCTLGIVGIISSIGFFDYTYNSDFFVYFTNLSNYLCILVMFCGLHQTIKRNNDDYVSVMPIVKFVGMLAMLLTFFVFNFLLSSTRPIEMNFKVTSVLFHVVLPIMYIVGWFLFYERKKVQWYYPLVSTIFPLTYVIFIFVRAAILKFDPNALSIYPYFFLDVNTLGVMGVFKWIVIIAFGFVAVGYILFGIDKINFRRKQ